MVASGPLPGLLQCAFWGGTFAGAALVVLVIWLSAELQEFSFIGKLGPGLPNPKDHRDRLVVVDMRLVERSRVRKFARSIFEFCGNITNDELRVNV